VKIMSSEKNKNCILIRPSGGLSVRNVEDLQAQLEKFLNVDGRKLIIDMSDVDFIDSNGLKFLVSIGDKLYSTGGELVIRRPQLGVQKLLEMMRVDQKLTVEKTEEDTTGNWEEFYIEQ